MSKKTNQTATTAAFHAKFTATLRALICAAATLFGMHLALTTAPMVNAQCPAEWVPGIGSPGVDNPVSALAVLPGGDVIACTNFGLNNITRFHTPVGVGGTWSTLGPGTGGTVYTTAVLPDGDLLVGGIFLRAGGTFANLIVRFDFFSGTWSSLSPETWGGTGVRALAVLPFGDLIAGGHFFSFQGVIVNNIARYDFDINPFTGQPFGWSDIGSVAPFPNDDPIVNALAVLPNGDVIVGGKFAIAGGVAVNNIACYDSTTGVWSAMGSGILGPFNSGAVKCLAVLPGGDVVVGGVFNTAGGVAADCLARYNPTTGVWSAVGAPSNSGGGVEALTVLPGGDVIAQGNFGFPSGMALFGILRYNPTTGAWTQLAAGAGAPGSEMAVLPDGDVIVAGQFTTAGGMPANNIARYSPGASAAGISVHPLPQSICPSDQVTFSVTATGTGPFTYQWRKGTLAIDSIVNPSAATSTLTLENVSATTAGSYDCIVTNACGSATSNAATLTVRPAPGGTIAPTEAIRKCVGDTLTMTVIPSAAVAGPFEYWWYQGGNGPLVNDGRISGARTATLVISPANTDDAAAAYQCVLVSPAGCASGIEDIQSPQVSVHTPVAIETNPVPRAVCSGASVSFTVVTSNASVHSLNYEWIKNGQPIIGAPSAATLSIASALAGDAGSYSCRVSNNCGSVTSNAATLTVTNCCPGCPPICPADFNADSVVDFFDYLDFVDAFGSQLPAADFNGDTVVDFFDYLDFVDAFGAGC